MATRYIDPALLEEAKKTAGQIGSGLSNYITSNTAGVKQAQGTLSQISDALSSFTPPPPVSQPPVDRTPVVGKITKANKAIADSYSADSIAKAQREADMYAAQMRQARIDAINTAFAPRIAREEKEGEARMSRVDALAFNRGVVGSGVDTTMKGEQKKLNEDVLRGIEDEKAIKINEAFGYADALGKERAELLTKQAQQSAEANLKMYQEQAERANEALKLFGSAGKTLDEIEQADPETMKTLREVSGLSDMQIQAVLNQNAPQPKDIKYETYGNTIVSYYTDPLTGKIKTSSQKLDIELPQDYKVDFAPDGTMIAYPNKFDPSQPIESQVKVMGKYAKPKEGDGSASTSSYKSEIATSGRQAISNMIAIATDNPGIFGRSAAVPLPDAVRSDAYRNYKAQIEYLKGNIIPAALSAMREASKTGGALGNVSDKEGAYLAASLGAISMEQDPKQVVNQLRQIDASLARWQSAVNQYGGQPTQATTQSANDQYSGYRSQLQKGEILVKRGNQIMAVQKGELLASDQQL